VLASRSSPVPSSEDDLEEPDDANTDTDIVTTDTTDP